MAAFTLTTDELADLLRACSKTIYTQLAAGDFPLEPIRLGRKILWPTAAVERLLGLEAGALSNDQPEAS